MMGSYIALCTVHTTKGQGTIGLHTNFPGPCSVPVLVPGSVNEPLVSRFQS